MRVLARKIANTVKTVAAIAGALALMLAITDCGGATAPSPEPSRLNLRAGPQLISFLAFAVSGDPQFPPCTPIAVPAGGTSISTRVMLEQSGSEWIARSSPPAAGSLELRLHASGVSTLQGEVVEGTVRGFATDLGQQSREPVDVTMRIGGQTGAAVLDGYVERSLFLASGRISGSISFSDSQNAAATCTAVQWLMQPVAGIFGPVAIGGREVHAWQAYRSSRPSHERPST
jgi:hypothetical protein